MGQADFIFISLLFWLEKVSSEAVQKNSQHVFYRVKNHSATPRGFKPDKTLLLVF